MKFYRIFFLNLKTVGTKFCEHLLLFSYVKHCNTIYVKSQNKTTLIMQINCVCDLYYLYPLSTIIHNNTPNSLKKKFQCHNPKKVSKKVATLEKTTVLCQSTFFISLCSVYSELYTSPSLAVVL